MSLSRFSLVPLDRGLVINSVDISLRLRGRREAVGSLCAAITVFASLILLKLLGDADACGRYVEVMLLYKKPWTALALVVDHECFMCSKLRRWTETFVIDYF